jgi:hypothetical protein
MACSGTCCSQPSSGVCSWLALPLTTGQALRCSDRRGPAALTFSEPREMLRVLTLVAECGARCGFAIANGFVCSPASRGIGGTRLVVMPEDLTLPPISGQLAEALQGMPYLVSPEPAADMSWMGHIFGVLAARDTGDQQAFHEAIQWARGNREGAAALLCGLWWLRRSLLVCVGHRRGRRWWTSRRPGAGWGGWVRFARGSPRAMSRRPVWCWITWRGGGTPMLTG